MEENSVTWKNVKVTCNTSLLKKIKSLGKMEYEVAWKMAEGSGTKEQIYCSIKFWVKIKDVSFT